jgi:hypothetical protein
LISAMETIRSFCTVWHRVAPAKQSLRCCPESRWN